MSVRNALRDMLATTANRELGFENQINEMSNIYFIFIL